MEQIDIETEKKFQEKQCAGAFLDWFNLANGTKYILKCTQVEYPELTGRRRWDFVARQENCSEWIAIEVKRVTPDEDYKVPHLWGKVFRKVNEEVKNKLKGTFSVSGLPDLGAPDLDVNQKKRSELAKAISQVILKASAHLAVDERVDIWPEITSLLSHWPPDALKSLTTRVSPSKVSKATLYLHKISDEGCHVGISMVSSSSVDKLVEKQAAQRPFRLKKDVIPADAQLEVAKAQGAKLGILLLDAVDWQLADIREVLATVSPNLLSNVDAVYHINVPHGQVTKVWPQDT